MNIIIPMGGRGERFKKEGYNCPKGLIEVCGKPMIMSVIDELELSDEDRLYVGVFDVDYKDLGEKLRERYPGKYIEVVKLSYQTRGALETLMCVLNVVGNHILKSRSDRRSRGVVRFIIYGYVGKCWRKAE